MNKRSVTHAATVDYFAAVWAHVAKEFGVSWYLYDTSLLCAATIGNTPENYNEITVAIHAMDRARVMGEVLTRLQDCTNCLMSRNGLTVTCTHPSNLENVVFRFGLLRPCSPEEAKTDARLRATHGQGKDAYDHPVPYPEPAETVTLNGVSYPTFANYEEYLAERFLDYETCFEDPMGCNLTREEKAELSEHQKNCIEALQFIEELSQKYNLKYRLLAGSVLGAVRHGGFIPWDDDIDVGICIEDLPLFEEMVQKHLPKKFQLFCRQAGVYYPRMFTKICCNNRCCIDLFPLIPVPAEGVRAKMSWFFGRFWRKLHYIKIGHYHDESFRMKGIAKCIAFFLSDEQIMRFADAHDRRYAHKNAPTYVNMYSIYSRRIETVPTQWVKKTVRMDFAGINVPVMGCTDEYLTHMYGDYMTQPFPWKRTHRHAARFNIADMEDFMR